MVKVLTVDDINSDKLYKTTVDLGGGEARQVRCSRTFFPINTHFVAEIAALSELESGA